MSNQVDKKERTAGQYLKEGERLDDLQIKGYEIIQSPGRFCFGMDAALLSDFALVRRNERALDLGTGTGILPILLEAKYQGLHYTGLEIQEESADMARRSVSYNGLDEKIDIVTGDIKGASEPFRRPFDISCHNIDLFIQPVIAHAPSGHIRAFFLNLQPCIDRKSVV